MLNSHTVERLVIYNRVLKDLDRRGLKWVTSKKIAEVLSKTPAQVRKDFSFLGKKGKPGVGYNIKKLIDDLNDLLGLKRKWRIAIIGAGNLGKALFYYPGFKREGFECQAVFDNDPKKIGRLWGNTKITSVSNINRKIKSEKIDISVVTVPREAAQAVTDKIINAGIKEILNFAPVTLNVPDDVNVRYADLAFEMENLSFYLRQRYGKKRFMENSVSGKKIYHY